MVWPIPKLSDLESVAATCFFQAALFSQQMDKGRFQSTGHKPTQSEQEFREVRMSLFESAQTLMYMTAPPEYVLTQGLSISIMDLTALRYINCFGVANAVPDDSSTTYAALASTLGVDESQLKRILRYVMTKGIFSETSRGEVEHTATSRLLRQKAVATLSRYSSDRGWPIACHFNDAIEKWGHGSQEPNETAFNVFKNTDLPMFDYHEQNPQFSADFHVVMNHFSKLPPLSYEHIKNSFSWGALSHATIVDIGGSLGHGSIAILEANPTLNCIVQDLARTVAQATDPATSIVPAHMVNRISFHEHSFWDPQIVTADIYFMRMIFHDWPDKYAKKILQALVVAMKPGSKLLIMDYVALPFGALKIGDERRMRMRDMQMMVMHNALERDEDEWKQLLVEADSRLQLIKIQKPIGSALSLIEVVLREDV